MPKVNAFKAVGEPEKFPDIDLNEFRDEGYLQEVNRQFLHPLGLALGIVADRTNEAGELVNPSLVVIDARLDPEGFVMDKLDVVKAGMVAIRQSQREQVRREMFGWMIQPINDEEKKDGGGESQSAPVEEG